METTWNSTAENLPAIQSEESDWVLVRLATGEVYVAQLRESVWCWATDDIEVRTRWVLRGQDGYEHDLTEVVAWTEIPA